MNSKVKVFSFFLIVVVLSLIFFSFVVAQSGEATITRNPLNFRSYPSVKSDVIAKLGFEAKYQVYSQTFSGEWYQLEVNGVKGWVCAKYVNLNISAENLPKDTSVVDEDCSGNTLTVTVGVVVEPTLTVVETPVPAVVVSIDSVPAYGHRGYMRGRVTGIDTTKYKATCFIQTVDGWYNKPYWSRPDTGLTGAGYFSCYVNTGTGDEFATTFYVYIVPKEVKTPLVGGESIPYDFIKQAIGFAVVYRKPT